MKRQIDLALVHAELCHALWLERSAARVYAATLPHAPSAREWTRWSASLEEARANEVALLRIFEELCLDPACEDPRRAAIESVAALLLARLATASGAEQTLTARAATRVMERREQLDWRLFAGFVAARSAHELEIRPRRARASSHPGSRSGPASPALTRAA